VSEWGNLQKESPLFAWIASTCFDGF